LKDPGVKQKLTALGIDTVGDKPEEFTAYIAAEIPKWAAIIKASGATME
jgi:tripartite-type tricarboxylate transporter receptor subunit TctC